MHALNECNQAEVERKTPPLRCVSTLSGGVLCILTSFMLRIFVLCRPGSDLLSQGLSHSTIGAEEFNGRVRDGIGLKLLARTTRPAKDKDTKQAVVWWRPFRASVS